MKITGISAPFGLDLRQLDRDISAAAERLVEFGKSDAITDAANLSLSAKQTGPASGEDQTKGAAANLGGLAVNLARAMAPLQGIGGRISQEFDRVGGTIITLARRIDASMKFPAFDAALSAIGKGVSGVAAGLERWALGIPRTDKEAKTLQQTIDKLTATVAKLAGGMAPVPVLVAEMEKGLARSTQQAGHLAALWGRIKGMAAGEGEDKGPPAGQRPGRGRAVALAGPKPPDPDLFDRLKGAIGAAAVAMEHLGVKADEAFAKVTMRGTTAGDMLRAGLRDQTLGLALEMTSLGVRGGGAFLKLIQGTLELRNYLGSLGDVAGKSFGQMFKLSKLSYQLPIAGVKALKGAVDDTSTATKHLGRELLAAFGIFGLTYKVAEFFKGAVTGASDLGETLSKTEVRFGEATGQVVKFADQMARDFGLVKRETLDAAAGFGGLGKSLAGLTGNELAAFSNKMTMLAADMSSQENKGFKEMSDALKIGLAGNQSDVLREMGVIITDVNVKAYALAHGIASGAKEMTESQKVMARMGLIMEKTRDAQGDLANTADSTANQFRKAGGGVQNFAASVGELLLPAVNAGTSAFNELLATVIEVFEANKERITSFAVKVKESFDGVGILLRNFGTFWQMAQLRVGAFVLNAIAWVETLPVNFGRVTAWVASNWSQLLQDLVAMAGTFFSNMLTNATNFGTALWSALKGEGFNFQFTPLLEGFKATADALPEMMRPALVDIQADLDRLNGEIQDREAKRTKAMAKALPTKGDPAAADPTKAAADLTPKLAGLAEMGSKEAFQSVAKFQMGGAGGDKDAAAKDTAKHTREIAEQAKETNKLLSRMGGMGAISLEMMGI